MHVKWLVQQKRRGLRNFTFSHAASLSVVLVLALTTTLWFVDVGNRRQALAARSNSLLLELRDFTVSSVQQRLQVVSDLRDIWVEADHPEELYDESAFYDLVAPAFQREGGYKAINWVDVNKTIRWVYPLETNLGALDASIEYYANGEYNEALNRSIHEGVNTTSPLIPFVQGGYGFVAYFPAVYGGNVTGVFNAVFSLEVLFEHMFTNTWLRHPMADYSLVVLDGTKAVFAYGENFSSWCDSFVYEGEVVLEGSKFQLCLRPDAKLRSAASFSGNFYLPVLGVALAVVVGLLVRDLKARLEIIERTTEEKRRFELMLKTKQRLEMLGAMVGSFVHDFNNLLTGIVGNAELLNLQLDDLRALLEGRAATPTELLEKIRSNSAEIYDLLGKSADMVRNLSHFTRTERLELKPLLVDEVVKAAIRTFETIVNQRVEVAYEFKLEEGDMMVGNAGHLQRAIVNLLINAWEARKDDHPRVGVVVEPTELDGGERRECVERVAASAGVQFEGEFQIVVEDDGVGIAPEILDKVFDPFFSTKKGRMSGMGMGLTTVFTSVNAMCGHIQLSSHVGVGTKFFLVFPLVKRVVQQP
ncbi:MAG: hypothetical protein Kow0069_36210 [Promethearchaeota archaeon]